MSDKTERRRIAVVGSGISGLTACYLLSSEHDVTLFEAAADLGMDAHSVDVPLPGGDTARIDMPLRVFSPKYYPHLTSLYNHVNIKSVPENYSGSFRLNDIVAPYFAYQNMLFGAVSLPFVSWRHVFSCEFWSHVRQMFKFHWTASTDLSSGRLASLSLGQYLQSAGYTDCFVHKFFIPFVCAICTCTFQAALDYPADVVVDYLIRRFLFGVRRADGGTKTVVHRLSKQCKEIKLNARIQCVQHTANHVKVTECNGNTSTFDDVVIATQAHLVCF
jgi:predicted NAD/FAD-binding protein